MLLPEPFRKSSWKNKDTHISEDTGRQNEYFLIFYLYNIIFSGIGIDNDINGFEEESVSEEVKEISITEGFVSITGGFVNSSLYLL